MLRPMHAMPANWMSHHFRRIVFFPNFASRMADCFGRVSSPTNLTFAQIHEIQNNSIRCTPSVQHFCTVYQLMLYLVLTLRLIRTNFAHNLIQFWMKNVDCFDASVSSRRTMLIVFYFFGCNVLAPHMRRFLFSFSWARCWQQWSDAESVQKCFIEMISMEIYDINSVELFEFHDVGCEANFQLNNGCNGWQLSTDGARTKT